ncbi:aminoglycoside 6-adenylyltransferase [Parablautia muri]|uniref:Aminoglycoside 6-adenylyltransferase n=1 Tax=Parablautia muri TaxID=2320879 RepID=A0A9X5BL21_9FIRM|nr:aminoglycoside 6-adenylyltransferase [Parablautia muri]NBJ94927.1 aminoglycoside 6-adenylyltransferase [Parablautia muri]
MRTESEMYNLILNIAKKDARIKAVYMNGSRTNENVPKDIFQDYDVVNVVNDIKRFIEDKNWIHRFGEILYMQYPDESPYNPRGKENLYGWLMQFTDGNRIDLTVQTLDFTLAHIGDDKLCKILLDKENILPKADAATDCQYWVKKPTKEQYFAVCNEFWWCTNNIAKGLWRKEIPYVQDMTNYHVRKQLITMLDWKVGILTKWTVSTGKSSKYLYRWLPEKEWQMFLSTYFDSSLDHAWRSVFDMCKLFEIEAQYVGKNLGWVYNEKEGKAALSFLKYAHQLSQDNS